MIMIKAYAKINAGLKIVGKDENDGYHLLDMAILPLELHDRIEITELPKGYDTIITCDDCQVPTDETNLVSKTIKILREKYGFKNEFRIHIHKIIPVGSGLGGGSADAASVLLALVKHLKIKTSIKELCEIGSKIGSDVPFCILNTSCRVTSKGEILEPLNLKNKYKVILARPKNGLITKEVYNKYDEIGSTNKGDIDLLIKGLRNNDMELIKNNLVNDLEDSAIAMNSDIQDIKEIFNKNGIEANLMTGSGSCVFGFFENAKKGEEVASILKKAGYITFITKTM